MHIYSWHGHILWPFCVLNCNITHQSMQGFQRKFVMLWLMRPIFLISFSFNIFANEDNSITRNKTFQIQAIVYSSLGTGLSLSYKITKNIWLNFDTQSLSGTMSIDSNDGSTREDADFEFQTKYINSNKYNPTTRFLFLLFCSWKKNSLLTSQKMKRMLN